MPQALEGDAAAAAILKGLADQDHPGRLSVEYFDLPLRREVLATAR